MTLLDRYYRLRVKYWRLQRLLFPSPAEVRFMKLLGAKLYICKFIRKQNGSYFTLILSRGKLLRSARLRREVRVGKCYVDFGTDLNWYIEIDGTPFHQDVVADMDREIYMREFLRRRGQDMRILRIPAPRLWNDPVRVRRDVLKFLNA